MSPGGPTPPRLPARLARRLLSPRDADRLLDALDDEYVHYQRVQRTRIGADLWYWQQVLRSVPPLRRGGRGRRRGRQRRGGSLRTDLLHLWRRLRRAPVSAGAAVLTLALTLGAGTSIFAVVDAVLLTPPPFEDPDALVTVGQAPADDPSAAPRAVSLATLDAWRGRAGSLAALEAYDRTNLTLTGLGAAERVSATNVTPGLLALLGVPPALGRLFDGDDLGQPVAVVSHGFWRGRLGADPAVIGREVVLGGRPHTVVGVLPEAFFFALNPTDVWRPLPFAPADGEAAEVRVVARLGPDVLPDDLAAALDDVSRTASPPALVRATPVTTAIAGDTHRTLGLLAGAAGLAMLIAFANLVVLLMVRSIDRRRELAVRRALGARRSETARQLVLESVALVGLGIVGGVLLALWATPAVGRLALEFGGLAQRELAVSWRAVGVVGAVALACGFVCGLLPALGTGRRKVGDLLRRGATSSAEELSLRRVLVAGEVALAFVLLVSMSLLGLSLRDVLRTDPGFDARGVLKLQVALPPESYPTRERAVAFWTALGDALGERLGPGTVAVVDEVPMSGDGGRGLVSPGPEDPGREAAVRTAGPGYFQVLRIPVVAGRPFTAGDEAGAPPRVVISESLARGLFGSERAVGRSVRVAGLDEAAEVVGVAGDVKHRALDEATLPTVYLSALQLPSASSILVIRSDRPAAAVITTVREEVRRLDADLPVYSVRTMGHVIAASPGVPARRLLTAALTAFALLAVVLGAIGLFGVAAHDVARRRAELALRMVLGARPLRILGETLRTGAVTVLWGLAAGGVLAFWAVAVLRRLLVTTGGGEVAGIGVAAAALLVAIGALAVLPVALRAAREDPAAALRSE